MLERLILIPFSLDCLTKTHTFTAIMANELVENSNILVTLP